MLELILVIVIIGILVSVAAQSMKSSSENERFDLTTREMESLARAIIGDERLISNGYRVDFGYVGDIGALPSDLDALTTNPGGFATWNGPYLRGDFVENIDGFKNDAWGSPYSYGGGIAIQSSGNGSSITKQFANNIADLTSNTVVGFVRDAAGTPPGDSASNVAVTIFYPDGAGSVTNSTTTPSRAGEFEFSSLVPIGIHRIQAVVSGVNDTSSKYLAIYPASVSLAELRFPEAIWAGGAPGGGSGGIILVDSTQYFPGGDCEDVGFSITNSSGSPIDLTSIILTWPSPTAYYRRVRYDGGTVWQGTNPRKGSGEIALFSTPRTIQPGATAIIRIEGFKDAPTGGNDVNMANTVFTVTFSDGSTFTVNMGNCSN